MRLGRPQQEEQVAEREAEAAATEAEDKLEKSFAVAESIATE